MVRHGLRGLISSVLYRLLIVSANALSYELPTAPTEGWTPACARRSTIAAQSSPTRCVMSARYRGGSARGDVCVAVPAGAEGSWTGSTSFGHSSSFAGKQPLRNPPQLTAYFFDLAAL